MWGDGEPYGCWYSSVDPVLFMEVARALGKKPEECYMVDDSINSLLNAKKAGLKVIEIYDNYSSEDENRI